MAFNFYQGKHGKRDEELAKQLAKSAATVLLLTAEQASPTDGETSVLHLLRQPAYIP